MKHWAKWLRVLKLAVYAGMASVMSLSCSQNSYEGKIVAVELAGEELSLEGATLVLLDPASRLIRITTWRS